MDNTMGTQHLYPPPFAYHPSLTYSYPDGGSGGQSLLPDSFPVDFIPFQGDMTQLHHRFEDEESASRLPTSARSPHDAASSQSDEVAKSPEAYGHVHGSLSAAAGGSCQSLSPSGASNILTPTSTLLDYHDGSTCGDPDLNHSGMSPASGSFHSPVDEYLQASDGELSGGNDRRMNLQPPHSGAASHLPGQTSRRSRESTASYQSSTRASQGQQWASNPSTSPASMDNNYMPYDSSAADLVYSADDFVTDQQHTNSVHGYSTPALQGQAYGLLPFRTHDLASQIPPTYANQSLLSQQQTFRQHATGSFEQAFTQQFNNAPALTPVSQYQNPLSNTGFGYDTQQIDQRLYPPFMHHPVQQTQRRLPAQMPLDTTMQAMRTTSYPSMIPTQPYSQQHAPMGSISPLDEKPAAARRQPSGPPKSTSDGSSSATVTSKRPLQKAEPGVPRAQPQGRVRKGGRSKHSHLSEPVRAKTHAMRKVGACWRCVLQRDSCDDEEPCKRCEFQSQRGQLYYFPCDRSKLPDFVHDFLPPQASMTLMHQKQSIEDTVSEQVLSWDQDNSMDVYLSSGYGPPLVWRLYEFKPKTPELLSQLQFYQDTQTGQSRSRFKYSPPFGLLKIDTSDDAHFDTYLDTLLAPENLWDFGWSCYEEESQVDADMFQAQLLDYMCKLYLSTADPPLKSLLKDILRMMIITFIMGHTLTIVEGTLPTVLSRVRHSERPPQVMKHTSPRLANRQLKFFFAVLRNNIYEKILKWQQQTLHTAGKKDQTWLQAFCVMLGFAMVLEEVQRTIQIQADAAAQKGEMSEEGAEVQARNACERIDQRFELLVGLFQCKYRDKKWTNGSFGPQTPALQEPVQVEFLGSLRNLVISRWDHLKSRENVTFSRENQCLYTTRLTARFLLPFLGLPR